MAATPLDRTVEYEMFGFKEAGISPQQVLALRPSEVAQQRVEDLIVKEKESSLTPDESSELDEFLQVEHVMRMMKAGAMQALQPSGS